MTDNSNLIVDATARIFKECGEVRALQNDAGRRELLWKALEDTGLTLAWIDEAHGGAGATLADGFEVLRIAGGNAVNVPLAETLLASWVLAQTKMVVPPGRLSIAPCDVRDRIALQSNGALAGSARRVPFGHEADHLAIIVSISDRNRVALVERARCHVTEENNLAGDASDLVNFDGVAPLKIAESSLSHQDLMLMGATARAMQMAGALQTVLDLSVAYANERVAFEKPIGKFQAIQHNLAKLAAETAAALAAAGSAADAINSTAHFDDAVFLEAASAKIRVGEATAAGAAIAHQVHGAIGFSQEHPLHCYTKRMLAWRDDFGSESEWALKLGRLVARNGVNALWPMLAAR